MEALFRIIVGMFNFISVPVFITIVLLFVLAIILVISLATGRVKIAHRDGTSSKLFRLDRVDLVLCRDCRNLDKKYSGGGHGIYYCKSGLAKPASTDTIKTRARSDAERYPCYRCRK